MDLEQLKECVKSGRHIRKDAQVRLPREDEVKIYIYIDLIKYGVIYEAGYWLDSDFAKAFKSLSIETKAELAEIDGNLVLPAALLTELYQLDYPAWTNSGNAMIKEMVLASAIVDNRLDLIDKDDYWALYRYFVNTRLELTSLSDFSNPLFVKFMLDKLITEKRVIFTWIVQNLISMIRASSLRPAEHEKFFVELFKESQYVQGERADLFLEAVEKHPRLFCLLIKDRLSIDPFSKQTNYSQWLRDSEKFLYLGKLRTIKGVDTTAGVADFDRRLMLYKDMNRCPRGLGRFS
ncbi:hypothetical protein [Alcaligenes aquatilis]|uniref:hypothetical protein n=1 Tax=Alcaligenes aquatilis TaxID=323284 RepID=UPI0013CED0BC|nr:hypothetical protein [Alcaligenes aquatilis]